MREGDNSLQQQHIK